MTQTPSVTPVSWRNNRLDLVLLVASLTALIILVWMLRPIVPVAFDLRFNPYSLISIAGLALNATLSVVLLKRSNRSNSVLWFSFFLLFGGLWSAAEALEHSAVTAVGAAYWGDIISGITTFMPAYFYLFVRSYTNKATARTALWVPVFVIGTAAAMGALLGSNNVFRLPVVTEIKPWGYPGPNSAVSLLFIIWAALLTFAAIGRLIAFYRKAASHNDRRLAVVFIVSATGLILVAGLTEVILPVMGVESIPPLGVFSNALLALGVIVGIYKYGSFSVGADEIAETILATMGDGVIVMDTHFQVLYRNAKAQELLASIGDDLMGTDLLARYGDQLKPLITLWEHDLAEHGYAVTDGLEVGTPAKRVTVNIHVTPLQSDHAGYIFVLVDVTKIRESSDVLKEKTAQLEVANSAYKASQAAMINLLEDARELAVALKREKAGVEHEVEIQTVAVKAEHIRLTAALDGLDISVYMLDDKLELIYSNRANERLFTSLSGQAWSPTAYMAALRANPDFINDVTKTQKDHMPVERPELSVLGHVLHTYQAPILDPANPTGPILGIVSSITDITEAKNIERSRDEFFSIASHELRTPLTAIRGNTSMIIDYFSDQLKDPTLKEMIGDIHDSSIRLITIVNDFLNTSRLEQGKIEFKIEPFEAGDLVDEVLKEFKAGDSGAKVPIRAKLSPVPNVLADRDRVKEVLINLIGNAVKFTDQGEITVGLTTAGDKVKLSVTDTGKGIPAESRSLLFRKFQQASNNILTRDSTRSTGLGLYISKLMVIGMGGEIRLDASEVGQGSSFAVTLPVASLVKPQRKTTKKEPV